MFHKNYFPIFVILASVVFALQKFQVALPPVINNYLNDFLCMPIVLYICRFAVRTLKSNRRLQIPIGLVFLITIGYAVYFEYYLPQFSPRYTGDIIDVFVYFGGAFFFIFFNGERNLKDMYRPEAL